MPSNPSRQPARRPSLLGLAALVVAVFALPASAQTQTNTQATQRAINYLSADVATWTTANGCVACHRQGAVVYGMASARANGYDMSAVVTNGRTNLQNLEFLAQRIKTDQLANGSATFDIPTTFAALGLSCFGDFSVTVAVVGSNRQELLIDHNAPQQATFTFRVKNHGYQADTYTLSTQGGLPGWSAVVSQPTLFLAAGDEGTVSVTVTAPPGLFPALTSEFTLIAASGGAPGVSGSARVNAYTPPLPPVTGRPTVTTIQTPATNAHIVIGQGGTLSARVTDAGAPVVGPGRGVVTFYVAGVPVGADQDADGDGLFTTITLTEGPNIITMTARDSFGGVTTRQVNLTVDRVAPILTIQSPLNGASVGSSVVAVTSSVQDQTPVRVETQWANVSLLEFGNGTVTHNVPLNYGDQGVMVRATDSAGNVTERFIIIWVDPGTPVVSTNFADSQLQGPLPNNTFSYAINVQTLSATTVRVNGGPVLTLARGGGQLQMTAELLPGVNTLDISVTSETGVTTHLTRRVNYDVQAPTATLLSPAPGSTTSGIITLRARVTDNFGPVTNVGFSRDRAGIRAGTPQPDGTWTAELDTRELIDGLHTIDLWMNDGVGNFTLQSFNFTVDNQAGEEGTTRRARVKTGRRGPRGVPFAFQEDLEEARRPRTPTARAVKTAHNLGPRARWVRMHRTRWH